MSKKGPNPIDQHVGARVRMRRLVLGMTQEQLGEALGLTFQQVQKYEKGMNRIGASRLQHLTAILQVPISFFFEGVAPVARGRAPADPALDPAYVDQFLATSDGLALTKAFTGIANPLVRRRIVALVVEIADAQGN